MSVVLDERAEDTVMTRNGKIIMIKTDFVPFPLGRNFYETGVYPCSDRGIVDYKKEIDFAYTRDKEAADINHANMINKWIKAVL